MYVVKNKEGLMMRVVWFPATPPCVGMFHEKIDLELATQFETEEEAHNEIKWLIEENDESASKFEGYTIEKI